MNLEKSNIYFNNLTFVNDEILKISHLIDSNETKIYELLNNILKNKNNNVQISRIFEVHFLSNSFDSFNKIITNFIDSFLHKIFIKLRQIENNHYTLQNFIDYINYAEQLFFKIKSNFKIYSSFVKINLGDKEFNFIDYYFYNKLAKNILDFKDNSDNTIFNILKKNTYLNTETFLNFLILSFKLNRYILDKSNKIYFIKDISENDIFNSINFLQNNNDEYFLNITYNLFQTKINNILDFNLEFNKKNFYLSKNFKNLLHLSKKNYNNEIEQISLSKNFNSLLKNSDIHNVSDDNLKNIINHSDSIINIEVADKLEIINSNFYKKNMKNNLFKNLDNVCCSLIKKMINNSFCQIDLNKSDIDFEFINSTKYNITVPLKMYFVIEFISNDFKSINEILKNCCIEIEECENILNFLESEKFILEITNDKLKKYKINSNFFSEKINLNFSIKFNQKYKFNSSNVFDDSLIGNILSNINILSDNYDSKEIEKNYIFLLLENYPKFFIDKHIKELIKQNKIEQIFKNNIEYLTIKN